MATIEDLRRRLQPFPCVVLDAPSDVRFDARRPPGQELIDVCVHCGFCLPACPTYVLRNKEMYSPRGRIVLMNAAAEDADVISDSMAIHWDRCFGCLACETACPSGVEYGKLIEATRAQVERKYAGPLRERAFRRLLFEAFTHPGRLRALVPAAVTARRLRLTGPANGGPGRFPRLRALRSLVPDVSLKASVAGVPQTTPARGQRRARVGAPWGAYSGSSSTT